MYDEATFDVFDRTVRGYIDHVVRKLGFGPYVTVDIIIETLEGIVLIERSRILRTAGRCPADLSIMVKAWKKRRARGQGRNESGLG